MEARLKRLICMSFGVAGLFAAGFISQAPARSQDQAGATHSLVGNYLAGRFARTQQDTLNAADFYGRALQGDPGNEVLLDQAFQMEVMSGNWPKAIGLAEQYVGH